MTIAESSELRALRRRFDDGKGRKLSADEQRRLVQLEFQADDELELILRSNPLIRWDHEMTMGNGWFVCACGAGGGGYASGRHVPIGTGVDAAAHRHMRQVRGLP